MSDVTAKGESAAVPTAPLFGADDRPEMEYRQASEVRISVTYEDGSSEEMWWPSGCGIAIERRLGQPKAQMGGVLLSTSYWPTRTVRLPPQVGSEGASR